MVFRPLGCRTLKVGPRRCSDRRIARCGFRSGAAAWRRASDTHQDQGCACLVGLAPGAVCAPENRLCRSVSKRLHDSSYGSAFAASPSLAREPGATLGSAQVVGLASDLPACRGRSEGLDDAARDSGQSVQEALAAVTVRGLAAPRPSLSRSSAPARREPDRASRSNRPEPACAPVPCARALRWSWLSCVGSRRSPWHRSGSRSWPPP